jgi:hypothetical protein
MMHQGNVGNYRLMMPQANPAGWVIVLTHRRRHHHLQWDALRSHS